MISDDVNSVKFNLPENRDDNGTLCMLLLYKGSSMGNADDRVFLIVPQEKF